MNYEDAVSPIRRRLTILLLRAFGAVVALTLIFMMAAMIVIGAILAGRNAFFRAPIAYLLESYYLGHGNWQGVEKVFEQNSSRLAGLNVEWGQAVLLDGNGQVVVDHGEIHSQSVGEIYPLEAKAFSNRLKVDDQVVGVLVFPGQSIAYPWRILAGLLLPVGFVSLFLGILTLLIGLLLTRRVVDPLAQVIAAAGAVAAGDLKARVPANERHDDLAALSTAFNQMASELERSDRQRREMFVDTAHELRTPLTIVRGRLEGILDGIYPACESAIAPALEEVYLLERLVDDLRLLALAENRQLHLETRPVDLAALAEKITATFEAQASEQHITLNLQAESDLPLVQVDPQRMEQVIGNLVGNALRFTPDNGQISVVLGRLDGAVRLDVRDSGPGVAESDLPFIFDRFWRGEKSRARSTGGAGLGLAIARQLVEAQGGTISAHNLPDGGLEVYLILK